MEVINVKDNNSNSEDSQHESEIEVAEQSQKSQKKEKSPNQVQEHITKDINFKENKKAVCNYCNATYKCTGSSTTNLSKHLKKHAVQIGEIQKQGRNIAEMFGGISKVNYSFFLFFSIISIY